MTPLGSGNPRRGSCVTWNTEKGAAMKSRCGTFRMGVRTLVLVVLFGGVFSAEEAFAQGGGVGPTEVELSPLEIGPVDGLTTTWHAAPKRTAVPLGTTVTFRQTSPSSAIVEWSGANPVRHGTLAEREFDSVGPASVRARVTGADGRLIGEHMMLVDVVDFPAEAISISPIRVGVTPHGISAASSNQETMDVYFGKSIASLYAEGAGRYVTSINRPVYFSTAVDPPEFAPLIEWRVDDMPTAIGGETELSFDLVGDRLISTGTEVGFDAVLLRTYTVQITPSQQLIGGFPEGVPVTMTATTTPPGYEPGISWIASTKFGTADTVVGTGAEFTVQFDHIYGLPEDGPEMWTGVKADNAVLGGDPIPTLFPNFPTFCPSAITVCPSTPTVCPVFTVCPFIDTLCNGGLPTLCEHTICPDVPTICPLIPTVCGQPTFCQIAQVTLCEPTICPGFPTVCPVIPTFCPSHQTLCPSGQPTFCEHTICPEQFTVCPEQFTFCPQLQTFCPPGEFTVCEFTLCPQVQTLCPDAQPTLCEFTVCPENLTLCPFIPTACPDSDPTICELTVCPFLDTFCPDADPTFCEFTVCPQQTTLCPVIETFCPDEDPTLCEYTICPTNPTLCPLIPTVCPADPDLGCDLFNDGK